MFSRFCKSCHNRADISVVNLRRYRILPTLLQEHDDGENKLPDKQERTAIIVCKRPKFNFYKGTTYSKFDTIPLASQGWQHLKSIGDYFTINPIHNELEEAFSDEPNTFDQFGLHPKLLENLREYNVHVPTEIQKIGIPNISCGQHTILSAETGCGKTFAFLLPTLNNILKWKRLKLSEERKLNSPFGLILTPSRELAEQLAREARKLSKDLDINVKILTGGRTTRLMKNPAMGKIDLLIGSFGVVSKMVSNKVYKLDYVRHVILDEAHALFHETFDIKLEVLLRRLSFDSAHVLGDSNFPLGSQLTLVSATKPSEMPEYLNSVLDINSLVNAATDNFHRVMVPQKFLRLSISEKPGTLLKLVKPKALKKSPVIVFSNDSATSDWISLFFDEFNIRSVNVNGEMPMAIRKGKFAAFQNGEFTVLSTTNAGARGLDTVSVNNIINYDLPMETADYIHRCGRTGRIGTIGECRVTNFICRPLEVELTQKIERATRRMRALPIFNMLEEHAKRMEKGDTIKGNKKSKERQKKLAKSKKRQKKSVKSTKRQKKSVKSTKRQKNSLAMQKKIDKLI